MEPGIPDAGGEAACWLHLVCPDCGRLNARVHPVTCEACGAVLPAAEGRSNEG